MGGNVMFISSLYVETILTKMKTSSIEKNTTIHDLYILENQ